MQLVWVSSMRKLFFYSETRCVILDYHADKSIEIIVLSGFEVATPKELGINDDLRKLGLGIATIEVITGN